MCWCVRFPLCRGNSDLEKEKKSAFLPITVVASTEARSIRATGRVLCDPCSAVVGGWCSEERGVRGRFHSSFLLLRLCPRACKHFRLLSNFGRPAPPHLILSPGVIFIFKGERKIFVGSTIIWKFSAFCAGVGFFFCLWVSVLFVVFPELVVQVPYILLPLELWMFLVYVIACPVVGSMGQYVSAYG